MAKRKAHYSVAEVAGILEFCSELDKLIRRVKARNPTTDLRDYFIALNGLVESMRTAVNQDRLFTIIVGTQLELGDVENAEDFYSIDA